MTSTVVQHSAEFTTGRSAEVAQKLMQMRAWLSTQGAAAIRLRGSDWFAWATAGGSNSVLLTTETGVAEILVTAQAAWILTDEIERQRLQDEEVGPDWQLHACPWHQPDVREQFVQQLSDGGTVLSDRPAPHEAALPALAHTQRMVLQVSEQERYRGLGTATATAMTEAMQQARPDWSECQLAAAGAAALWRRGVQPALVLVAGADRLPRYRHPVPTVTKLGRQAMMVFCGRRHGLYANLTRSITFDTAPQQQQQLLALEAVALAVCRPGQPLAAVYHALAAAYRAAHFSQAIEQHHQGGITGYRAREVLAHPDATVSLQSGMALALNPSLPGIKVEDTFLLSEHGLANLTFDADWPSTEVQGRRRPLWLCAA